MSLIDLELFRPADDVHDHGYVITRVIDAQRLKPVDLPSREELAPQNRRTPSKPR
jgi:hypothetical protein